MIRHIAASRLLFVLWLWWGLQQWIDAHRLRIVILPTGPGGLFLWRKPKGCRLVIVSYHTYWQQARLVPGQWWKMLMVPWERRTLALADRVLCYSLDTERVLLQKYGVHRTKLTPLPQLFDIDAWCPSLSNGSLKKVEGCHPEVRAVASHEGFCSAMVRGSTLSLAPHHDKSNRFPKEPNLCVFVGRLDRRKGIDVLLRTWERLRAYQYTSILIHRPRLVIVGDGPYRRGVRSLVAQSTSVQWFPSLPQEELVELVQRAVIALCPSYLEGFGLACAEAMAAGTCVIASDCDGLRSLITHEETGWLVRPGDPEALVSGLSTLLCDAALRRRLADAARDSVRRRFVRCDAARLLMLECSRI